MNGLVLGSHGLITWAATGKACYETTLRIIQQAADWLDAHGKPEPFGPTVTPALDKTAREALLARIGPALRGMLSAQTSKVLHYLDTPGVLEFVGSARAQELAAKGTTCPDHFLRTKVTPLYVPFDPAQGDSRRSAGEAAGADRAVSRRLHRVLRALQASEFAGDARSVSGAAADPGPRPAVVPEGQIDGARRGGVLRQHDQRDALGRRRRRIRADRRAGSVRHRILAARGSEAAAAAEA